MAVILPLSSAVVVASEYVSEIGMGDHGLIHIRGTSLAAPHGSMLRPIRTAETRVACSR